MDKIFNVEIDGQITLPDGRKLGPFEETTVNVVQPSECAPDPIVENAKQTGGFGYTEQGEQIIVDNEIVTTVDDEDAGECVGQFETSFDIVDGAYTVIFNGTEYNLNSTFFEDFGFWYLGELNETGADFSRYPFNILVNGRNKTIYTEFAGDYDVTIKTESDTIHKIDEKYLPASGGGVTTLHINVSAINLETFEPIFTADKTVEEIANCQTATWCVVTFAAGIMGEEAFSIGVPPSLGGTNPCFGRVTLKSHDDDGYNKYYKAVSVVTDEFDRLVWHLDVRAFEG